MNKLKWIAALLFTAVLNSPSWATPVLQIDAAGKLIGASGVDISGTLYDVQFMDGKCNELFSGCDQPSDFIFTTPAAAESASAALLNHVFVGIYDLDSTLTWGCAAIESCNAYTPFLKAGNNV